METSLGDDVTETPEIEEELLSQTINAHSPETQVKKKKSLLSEVLVNGLLKNINEKVSCHDKKSTTSTWLTLLLNLNV